MSAIHIPCGQFETKSEEDAIAYLKPRLSPDWILLSNFQHSSRPTRVPDDIDILAIGPTGVFVIEVKHWDVAFLKQNAAKVEYEADKLNGKARRIASRVQIDAFVPGRFLLTLGDAKYASREPVNGARFYSLKEWKDLLEVDRPAVLKPEQVRYLSNEVNPKIALGKDPRTFGPYSNLELQTPKDDRFRRVFRGIHSSTRDRVILHRYDLSASDSKNPYEVASREYEAIRRLQKLPSVPSIRDSFQAVPEFPGEIFFWSLVDPSVPSIRDRIDPNKDPQNLTTWPLCDRLAFAAECACALREMHQSAAPELVGVLHRNLSPSSIRRRSNNKPVFTDFLFAQLPGAATIASLWQPRDEVRPYTAPEILESGLSVASQQSDIYALCASLVPVFEDIADPHASLAIDILRAGITPQKSARPSLDDLSCELREIAAPSAPTEQPSIPARYWDEDLEPRVFNDKRYKILSRLGGGGIGSTFKVVQVEQSGGEEFGTFVAKVIEDESAAGQYLRAYQRARTCTVTTPHLAKLFETASEWKPDEISALLEWIDGMPLADIAGYVTVHAETQSVAEPDDLALLWIEQLCQAFASLHRAQLVHGDVSPKNIIVRGTEVVLTDYDMVTPFGKTSCSRGTLDYCSPNTQAGGPLQPADDLFSLSATFFHVLFERPAFRYSGVLSKDHGPNWDGVNRTQFPLATRFVERGLSDHPFESTTEVFAFIRDLRRNSTLDSARLVDPEPEPPVIWTPQQEPWLSELLRSYPGGTHGNRETRGLDSDYSTRTYVPTALDESLYKRINDRTVSLIILCGNAGDGKTAFLQHLASRLGMSNICSAQRIWKETLANGVQIYANLDGSAAFSGRTAEDLLDELFAPFLDGQAPPNRVHLLAINSGPLLAWIEQQHDEKPLVAQLESALGGDLNQLPSWMAFVDLNARSLVGGMDQNGRLSTHFLDRLFEKMLGLDHAWSRCSCCTAQTRCPAWSSVQILREPASGWLLKRRIYAALQAVHQRGEIHATARELRAALTYILFDVYECNDLHEDPNLAPASLADRAFNSQSPFRQGEILRELTLLDPALEAHPAIDRQLRRENYGAKLGPARRQAYFRWSDEKIEQVGNSPGALALARGRHLQRFIQVPAMAENERAALCAALCQGIARLEELPQLAFDCDPRSIPLRITPRTPTESAFWVSKPLDHFRLSADLPLVSEPVEQLHNTLRLTYTYADNSEETLLLGSELFHLLLELKDGFQLSDTLSDDTFAHLSIFTQRLVQEDERSMRCWNPMDEGTLYEFAIKPENGVQQIALTPIRQELI